MGKWSNLHYSNSEFLPLLIKIFMPENFSKTIFEKGTKIQPSFLFEPSVSFYPLVDPLFDWRRSDNEQLI